MSSLRRGSWARSAQGDIPPDGVPLGAKLSISESGEEVATRTEVVAYGAKGFEESLRLVRRLKALHRSLALADRPMRILSSVVQAFVAPLRRVR